MTPQVLIPKVSGRARVRFDYRPDARALLKSVARGPEWHKPGRFWSVPRSRALDVGRLLTREYGSCEVLIWSQHDAALMCDIRCREARGIECVCGCRGRNHGRDGVWSGGWDLASVDAVRTDEDWSLHRHTLTAADFDVLAGGR